MSFNRAEISDVLRAHQRDTDFINELQEIVGDFMKLVAGSKYNRIRHLVPTCTTSWYYLLTSVSNLQTLGEEYTGTMRVDAQHGLVSQFGQVFWLLLYVGGNRMLDRCLIVAGRHISQNRELTNEARQTFLKSIDFLKENKYIFLRMHQSIFYIFGNYHNVANRLSGIKYVLLRQWMQDATATKSFNALGYVSLFYLVYVLLEKIMKPSSSQQQIVSSESSAKVCPLCSENCKNISVTPCGHLFCWECIYNSLKFQFNCPVCREDLKPSRIIPLQNF